MIEMEMSVDNDANAFRVNFKGAQRFTQGAPPRNAKHLGVFRRPLVADPGFNQYAFFASINENAIHVQPDAVLLIRRTNVRPKRARNNAEHRPSVEAKLCVGNNLHPIIAKLHFAIADCRVDPGFGCDNANC